MADGCVRGRGQVQEVRRGGGGEGEARGGGAARPAARPRVQGSAVRILLPAAYALPGTEVGYGGTRGWCARAAWLHTRSSAPRSRALPRAHRSPHTLCSALVLVVFEVSGWGA
eukprot:3452938-Rhodomonas_salina.2